MCRLCCVHISFFALAQELCRRLALIRRAFIYFYILRTFANTLYSYNNNYYNSSAIIVLHLYLLLKTLQIFWNKFILKLNTVLIVTLYTKYLCIFYATNNLYIAEIIIILNKFFYLNQYTSINITNNKLHLFYTQL